MQGSVLHSGRFTPAERGFGIHWMNTYNRPGCGGKENNSCPRQVLNPGCPTELCQLIKHKSSNAKHELLILLKWISSTCHDITSCAWLSTEAMETSTISYNIHCMHAAKSLHACLHIDIHTQINATMALWRKVVTLLHWDIKVSESHTYEKNCCGYRIRLLHAKNSVHCNHNASF